MGKTVSCVGGGVPAREGAKRVKTPGFWQIHHACGVVSMVSCVTSTGGVGVSMYNSVKQA